MSEPDKKTLAVPKFASFKPKTVPSSDPEKDNSHHRDRHRHRERGRNDDHSHHGRNRSRERRSERDRDRDKHRSHGSGGRDKDHSKSQEREREQERDREHDRDRHRDRDRRHHRDRDRDKKREESPSRHHHGSSRPEKESSRSHQTLLPLSTKSKPSAPKPIDISSQDFFVIDTKGDPLIHLGLDRYSIPNFGRQKRRYLLGTSARLYMHYDGPHEQFSLLQPGEYIGPPPLRNKKLTFSMTKPLKPTTGKRLHSQIEDTDDIVYVTKRQRHNNDSSDSELEPDYRSIAGKAKPKYYSDSEHESDVEMQDDVKPEENPLKARSIELSRRVKTDPTDIPAWVDLIDLQEDLLRLGISPDQEVSGGHVRSTADITLSMIDKALKSCTRPEDHEALLLRQMFHGRKAWSPDDLRKRWANIASGDYGSRFALWMARVDYEMTEPAGFNYETVRKMYVERVQGLMEKAQRYQTGAASELYAEVVYVFLRMTRFMHDAGYRELAVAAWQALVELNFFRPPQPSGLDAFSDFWESEVLRAGEQGAQGWSEYVASGGEGTVPEPKETSEGKPAEGKHVYASWAANEVRCSLDGRMPARTMDDGTGDDPLRLVMASDLDSLLLQFPESHVPELQEQLVDALLIFSHLDPVFKSSQWTQRAMYDAFLAPSDASLGHAVASVSYSTEEQASEKHWFLQSTICPGVVPEFVWSLYRKWDKQCMASAPVEISWTRNVLLQLSLSRFPVKGVLGYVMALDWLMDPGSIRSAARKIIQMDPTNPELYKLYAVLEYQNGNPDVGARVFSSAVALKTSLPANPVIGSVALSWVYMELVHDSTGTKTLPRLCSMIDGMDLSMQVTSTRLLSVKQSLLKCLEVAVALGDAVSLSIVSKALILFTYASEAGSDQPQNDRQGNISAAMDVFWAQSAAISSLPMQSPLIEQDLCNFCASLMLLYSCRGPYQRAFLNSNIERCLQAFPRNVFLIDLLGHVNASHLLHSAFQSVVQNVLLARPNDCVSTRACVVAHEVRCGTVHSAQAALERSLASSWEVPTASIGLWMMYTKLCCQKDQPKKASCEAYYRAVSRCPWSRELAVHGFLGLENALEDNDFQAAFETMANRRLRIHIDLDEYSEQMCK